MPAVAESACRIDASTVLSVAFCEACERVIFVRSLLNDPRHLTRRQGTAVTRLLRDGLNGVEQQLAALRPLVFGQRHPARDRALAGIGIGVAALRQVHAHLGLLGTRWQLGTVDLFVRKLVAEGVSIQIPTLCPTDRYESAMSEVGEQFAARLIACGLEATPATGDSPILTIPTMDLIDPLTWAIYLYPLSAAMVAARGIAAQLRRPSSLDHAAYRRLCVAGFAAKLVGEATFAARAARTLLDRLSGADGCVDIALLGAAGMRYQRPIGRASLPTISQFFTDILETQKTMPSTWGMSPRSAPFPTDAVDWSDVDAFLGAELPDPVLPSAEEAEALFDLLSDRRPINARPPALPADFEERLGSGADAEAFYAVVPFADERPCSLATILNVGWQYKVRRTYALCNELMTADHSWPEAMDALTAHVIERCALLQQSIEAAYVQQMFSRLDDR